jgi:hypothetical protein
MSLLVLTITSLALIITGIHVTFWPGNIFSSVRELAANGLDKLLGRKWSRYVQKPMWDCLPCMASLWTCVLTWRIDILLMLGVCGFLLIVDNSITHPDDEAETVS